MLTNDHHQNQSSEVYPEFSVKYMIILGKYMMLNTMVMAKRYCDDEC